MATPCFVIGQGTISLPHFHFRFCPKYSTHEFSNLSLNRQQYSFSTSISNTKPSLSRTILRNCTTDSEPSSCNDKWVWTRWNQHFTEIEKLDSLVSLLKVQLEEAIEVEDFEKAVKLKTDIDQVTFKDTVTEIMSQLNAAILEERYSDASRLCNETGSGMVGWWAGCSSDSEEPFGRIVHITQGFGRFIGTSYSPRQLMAETDGTPLFEIFVVKDADGDYVMQVVYLQRNKPNLPFSEKSELRAELLSDAIIRKPTMLDVGGGDEVKVDKKEEDKPVIGKEPTEDGIRNVINFLKDRIPGINVRLNEDVEIPELEEEIVGSVDDAIVGEEDIEETSYADDEEDEGDGIDEIISTPSDNTQKYLNKLFIGGVLHNAEDSFKDSSTKDEFVRVSASINDIERDSFILHVPKRSKDGIDSRKNTVSKEQVTALEDQGLSELMPPEVAKALWGHEKASLKVSRNVQEIVKLAISQGRNGNRLSEYTTFNRIISPNSNLDPFDGLYVGAFGPYGTEIVQLKRKYGRWDDEDTESFEYVEAVKLTGDPNVPAGQVTFRAKIEKGRTGRSGTIFPEELGVVATYGGQGRLADFGFKNPRWVEGNLLKLNGKGMVPYTNGAELGFVYIGPKQKFVVLFNRLRLPE